MLNGHAVFHTKSFEKRTYPFRGKDTHEIILQGHIKTGRTRIALSGCAATKLVVNTARLVPLRSQYVQSAEGGNALTEDNVGAASGHVRCDGNGSTLARL